jgi:hypothetical protein
VDPESTSSNINPDPAFLAQIRIPDTWLNSAPDPLQKKEH